MLGRVDEWPLYTTYRDFKSRDVLLSLTLDIAMGSNRRKDKARHIVLFAQEYVLRIFSLGGVGTIPGKCTTITIPENRRNINYFRSHLAS